MAMGFKLLLIYVSFLCAVSSGSSDKFSKGDINRWCNTTPHSGPCDYYVKNHHHPFKPPKRSSDFGRIMVKLVMEISKRAKSQAKNIKQHLILNQITALASCTNFDAQTWLSGALTNIHTCKTSSIELNVTEFISPLLSNNVTELVTNSLALNNGCLANATKASNKGFPDWVTRNERRLLQSSSVKANLVVAKDASGSHRSIQSAINVAAAARRTGRTQFIIRIKAGVYKENIEVGNNVKNIMLIGDGMKKTVITGSRSIRGGSSTYNSATVGINESQGMESELVNLAKAPIILSLYSLFFGHTLHTILCRCRMKCLRIIMVIGNNIVMSRE